MKEAIRDYLPWLLSAITIWMTLLAGNMHRNAWLVGLGNQLLWLIWIVAVGAWGLIPLNVALWAVYARNHFKWQGAGGGRIGFLVNETAELLRRRYVRSGDVVHLYSGSDPAPISGPAKVDGWWTTAPVRVAGATIRRDCIRRDAAGNWSYRFSE